MTHDTILESVGKFKVIFRGSCKEEELYSFKAYISLTLKFLYNYHTESKVKNYPAIQYRRVIMPEFDTVFSSTPSHDSIVFREPILV
ncbi:hypothetical protein SAMN04489737_0747 [Arcanobacterium phocae]|uniref:Uncharacterized protein n=1 Tax=Arcanobacterium phocae TaxID=131112 RepID=A0A1H2LDX2_9ACTO|nr:hypothetical protein SAMN04489737_0747 [Arcanobacterium phocae]